MATDVNCSKSPEEISVGCEKARGCPGVRGCVNVGVWMDKPLLVSIVLRGWVRFGVST